MKKFASLVLVAVLLAAMLTVFAVPAFAEDAPVEVVPEQSGIVSYITITANGNYIISKDCTVTDIDIGLHFADNVTLTIAEGVTVTVKTDFHNFGTINILGTLKLANSVNYVSNEGTINVFGCCGGNLVGNVMARGTVVRYTDHVFVDGVCACGAKADENTNLATGSVLSDGNLTIIVGVAAAVIFGLGGFILGTKKKKKETIHNS